MTTAARFGAVALSLATLGAGLTAAPRQALEFEVASVKKNLTGSTSSRTSTLPGGQFVATNVTAKSLIAGAYRLRGFQIVGGPTWLESDRFDVMAKAPNDAEGDELLAMLRALLADRFRLATHTETREDAVYQLVRLTNDRLGPQIKPSILVCSGPGAAPATVGQPSPCGLNTSVGNRGGTMTGGAQSGADIAAALGNFAAGRQVIDRTGLMGTFDYTIRWTPEDVRASAGNNADLDLTSIFTAVQEQLGLKLEPARGPVEFLVIDRLEQPTEN